MLNHDTIKNLSKNSNEPEWMLERRLKAFDSYQKMPMPIFKYGIGIFLDSSDICIDNIDPSKINENTITCNDKNVEILSFKEAFRKHEMLMKKYLASAVDDDKFSSLHRAFLNKGTLIIIHENTSIEFPIELDITSSFADMEHILIIAEENSNATIIENIKSSKEKGGFRNSLIEIIAKENAKISYISVQNLDADVNNFTKRTATAEKDASINWLDCCIGSKFTQSTTSTLLNGTGAENQLLGLFLGDGNQRFDINVETIHNAPKTTCNMHTKGVLNDNGKNVYRGLIRIQPNAYQCKGYQKSDTLLLGENTETDPVPVLEIHNDDVKCGHGATVGQIDRDKIFYMTSRGLSEQQAMETIIKGFFEPMLKHLKEELQNELREEIHKRIERGATDDNLKIASIIEV